MFRRNASLAVLMAGALTWSATDARAQTRPGVALEGRAGVTFPVGDLSDAGAESGITLGADLMLNFHPRLTAYAGLSRHAFNCGNGCDLGSSPRSSGVGAGLKMIFPSPGDALAWAQGGLVAHRFSSSEISGDRNLGFEVGGGIDLRVTPRFYLVPTLRLLSHEATSNTSATFMVFGVGGHYHVN